MARSREWAGGWVLKSRLSLLRALSICIMTADGLSIPHDLKGRRHLSRQAGTIRKVLSGFLFILIALVYGWFELGPRRQPETATPAASPGSLAVYFTDPDAPGASSLRGGVDQHLADAIAEAQYSVDVAVLRLDLWSIRDALIDAHHRGVEVRVVTDGDYVDEDEIQDLLRAGIDVVADTEDALMHHKFVVIDGIDVWTGSMNFTVNGAYRHNNNLLYVHSRDVAEDYAREFEEMYADGRFGAASRMDTPHPLVNIDGAQTEIYFSPDDMAALHIVDALENAQDRIVFMAYTITLDAIADVLIERAGAGVEVIGVLEREQAANLGSDVDRLLAAGVDLRLDGNPDKMHHKVFVIDDTVVITGSYNYSQSAESRNDENVVIVRSAELAQRYVEEFNRIWAAAAP